MLETLNRETRSQKTENTRRCCTTVSVIALEIENFHNPTREITQILFKAEGNTDLV